MAASKRNADKETVIEDLRERIAEGSLIFDQLNIRSGHPAEDSEWRAWSNRVHERLERSFADEKLAKRFYVASLEDLLFVGGRSNIGIRHGSPISSKGLKFLESLIGEIASGLYDESFLLSAAPDLNTEAGILVLKRILNHFQLHIKAMYQDSVHGGGTIRQEDLEHIRIGNEYDVQRILYALIRPVFPEARMEVVNDAGYKSNRYDILVDESNAVIEVKCTRPTMTERQLTEELGSDAFHYTADYLFFFIYDPSGIVRNAEALKKSFRREKEAFGKNVELFIIQPIRL